MTRTALAVVVAVLAAGCGGDGDDAAAPVEVITQTTAPEAQTGGSTEGEATIDGRALFVQNCSGCHTLADAGTTGKVGPNLDETKPSYEHVRAMVMNGGTGGLGSMPPFKRSLSAEKIEAIARYVADNAGP
jgi:cytochrome c6